MKKLALVAILLGAFGSAQATGLSIVNPTGGVAATPYNNYDGQPFDITGASNAGKIGNLSADTAGYIEFTYLGQESTNRNRFVLDLGLVSRNFYDNNGGSGQAGIGDTFGGFISAGLVDFRFRDVSNDTAVRNGANPNTGNGLKFAFIGNVDANGNNFQFDQLADGSKAAPYKFGQFDYILGFNDAGGDNDFDDLVVGVKFTPRTPSAVPVPAALPLMATALGLFGFGASRRRV